MSELFEKGYEYEKQGDYENALRFYKQAAEQGDINAQLNIGHIYRSGRSGEKNPQLAAKYYLQAAEQGAVGAQRRLGDMYEFGDGVAQNFSLAAEWYRKAADQGDAGAQWRLAQLYENGKGVDFDIDTALYWYLKADKQNSSAAQWRIGTIYLFGTGLQPNYSLAKEWFEKAIAQCDHPCAHLFLGYMCRDGLINNASPEDAISHWVSASNYEHPIGEASYNLGYAYYDGYGVERDLKKAKEYFEKAIEQGYQCSYALNMVKASWTNLTIAIKCANTPPLYYKRTFQAINYINKYRRICKKILEMHGILLLVKLKNFLKQVCLHTFRSIPWDHIFTEIWIFPPPLRRCLRRLKKNLANIGILHI